MTLYIVNTPVKNVEGCQRWLVEAESAEAALEAHNGGHGDFMESELEVVSLDEPFVEDVYRGGDYNQVGPAPVDHELEYLRFFISNADFGPAHEDVLDYINEAYTKKTGKPLPEGYRAD